MKTARLLSGLAAVLLLLAAAALPCAGCMETTVTTDQGGGATNAELERELRGKILELRKNTEDMAAFMHEMINAERRKEGLAPLQWDQDLAEIALAYSTDMGTRDYFDHINPEGEDFADRYQEYGYRHKTYLEDSVLVGGENLSLTSVVSSYTYSKVNNKVLEYRYASADELAESTVQGWMESPDHRENILTPFTREGIGIFVTDEGEVYITENFS